MGTNYYLYQKPPCSCCGRPFERQHIGKSSFGWCFSLHVMPEEGINDLADWRALWNKPGAYVEDEYGTPVSVEDMEAVITQRGGEEGRYVPKRNKTEGDWPESWWNPGLSLGSPYNSEEEFHQMNHSARGPDGLLRHQVDGRHCVKQGEGTWDCVIGEFS